MAGGEPEMKPHFKFTDIVQNSRVDGNEWEYLGIWQLKDLKAAISSVEVAGSIDEVANLLLEDGAEPSRALPSIDPLAKADTNSAPALVGDAKGLSGRLCSKKLHTNMIETMKSEKNPNWEVYV